MAVFVSTMANLSSHQLRQWFLASIDFTDTNTDFILSRQAMP
jgi:hypothetical protein